MYPKRHSPTKNCVGVGGFAPATEPDNPVPAICKRGEDANVVFTSNVPCEKKFVVSVK